MGTTQKRLKPKSSISEEQFWQMLTSGKIGTHVGTVKIITKKIKISFADVDIETSDDTKFAEENFGEYDSRNIRLQYPPTQRIET